MPKLPKQKKSSKQRDVSASSSPGTPKSRKAKNVEQSNKITGWLSKSKLAEQQERDRKQFEIDRNAKLGESTRRIHKRKLESAGAAAGNSNKKKESKTSLKRSYSFEKYGIVLPTFEEIMQQKKEHLEHKKIVESLNVMELPDFTKFNDNNKIVVPKKPRLKVIDCKHLTSSEIKDAFYKNLDFLKSVFNGQRYSERHARFHNPNIRPNSILDELTCSLSAFIFTHDHQSDMVSLMEKEIDPAQTKYYFQVLLHELCLKIFCDVYKMDEEEALRYLKEMSLLEAEETD